MCGIGFGQMVGAGAGGMIMALLGWRAMCVFFGLLTLAWLIPWSRVRMNQHQGAADTQVAPVPLVEILRRRAVWGSAAAHFCNNYGLYFVITWLPLYLVGERGMSIVWMATVTAAIYGIQALSCLTSDDSRTSARPPTRTRSSSGRDPLADTWTSQSGSVPRKPS